MVLRMDDCWWIPILKGEGWKYESSLCEIGLMPVSGGILCFEDCCLAKTLNGG